MEAPDSALVQLDHILVNAVFLVSVMFVPVTSLYWPWWKTWWSRNIVLLELCISGTLFGSVLLIDFGIDSEALRWLQAGFLLLVGVIVVWRMIMIFLDQRAGARSNQDGDGHDLGR